MRWALLVLLVAIGPARAQDNLQLAREQIEARSFGDAFKFIKADLQANPRSWRGYHMLGEYYERGLSQPDQAITAWLKAWNLAVGRTRIGNEVEEFRLLGEQLTAAVLERARAAGDGGPKLLEQALVEHNFVSLPVLRPLLERCASLAKWTLIRKLIGIVNKQKVDDYYRQNESELAWLDYYDGKALAGLSDPMNAYAKLSLAQRKGITEAGPDVAHVGAILDTTALEGMTEANNAYQAKNYQKAKEIYVGLLAKLPDGLPSRDRAVVGLQNAEVAASIEAANMAVEAARKKGDFAGALAVIDAALAKYPSDPRLQDLLAKMQATKDQITAHAAAQTEAREKADQEAAVKRTQLITEAEGLRSHGKFQEAGDKLREAQKLRRTDDVARMLDDMAKSYEVEEAFDQAKNSFKKRDWAATVTALGKVVEADATYHDREVQRMLALSYFELRQTDKGRDIAEKVLTHTEDPDLLRKMADVCEGTHESRVEMGRAIGYLERLARVDSDPQIQSRINDLNWELNRPKYYALGLMAILWVGGWVFVKKRPDWSKKINLGDLERFVAKKKYKEATDLHGSLLKMHLSEQEELQARQLFARAFFESGNYQKGISECQHILRVLPDNKQLKVLLARCLWATKNISPENLQYFLELMEAEPQNKELMYFVGQFALKKKLVTPMTLPILRALAQASPEDDALRSLLIKGYIKENDRTSPALALYEVERKKNPKNLDVRVVLAEDYLRKGEVTRAIQECEEIINIELNHPRTHEILARAYAKLGKTSDLIALYQSLLEADPHNGAIVGFLTKLTAGDVRDRSGTLDRPVVDAAERSSDAVAEDAVEAPEAEAEPEAGSGRTARPPASGRERTLRPAAAERRGAPASIQRQMELFGQSGTQDKAALEAAAAPPAAPASRGLPTCRKCGKEVPPGTYFCSCGQAL